MKTNGSSVRNDVKTAVETVTLENKDEAAAEIAKVDTDDEGEGKVMLFGYMEGTRPPNGLCPSRRSNRSAHSTSAANPPLPTPATSSCSASTCAE